MSEERFNPLYVIGKTRKEGIEYFDKFNIIYHFKSCIKENFSLAIHTSYKEGTHFYKIYDFNSKNPHDDIILSFKGVQGKNITNIYNHNNNPNLIINSEKHNPYAYISPSIIAPPSVINELIHKMN